MVMNAVVTETQSILINNCFLPWSLQSPNSLSAPVATYLPIAFARQAGKLFSPSQLKQKDKRKLFAVGTLGPQLLRKLH